MKKAQIKKLVLKIMCCLLIGCLSVGLFLYCDYLEHKNMTETTKPTIETIAPNEAENEVVEVSADVPTEPIETRKYFNVPLDQDVQDVIFEECEKADISPALVVAIIERESDFDPEAIGDGGRSVGLMQIQIKWHMQRMIDLGCEILTDPCQNVKVGINYLSELKTENSNIFWVLMSYNGGQAYANRKMADNEITDFASSIIARAYELGGDL